MLGSNFINSNKWSSNLNSNNHNKQKTGPQLN